MKNVNENRSQDLKIFSQTTLCNWPYEIADHHLSENRMRGPVVESLFKESSSPSQTLRFIMSDTSCVIHFVSPILSP